ncbi:unnamed protein product, partial [marine sediment metagenome]
MKVDRYLYGSSNIAQLKSRKQGLRSPADVAAEAAAPYEMVSDIADTTVDTLQFFNEKRIKEENRQDATQLATRTALAKSALTKNAEQAKLENWSQEEFNTGVDEIVKNYASDTSMYTDRNRDDIANTLGTNSQIWLAEAETQGMAIKSKQVAQDWAVGLDAAAQAKEYDTVKFMADMGFEAGIIDQIKKDEILRNVAGSETADALMVDYTAAVEAGKVDEFMS